MVSVVDTVLSGLGLFNVAGVVMASLIVVQWFVIEVDIDFNLNL